MNVIKKKPDIEMDELERRWKEEAKLPERREGGR